MYIPQGTTEIRLTATGVDGSVGESVVAVTDAVPAPVYPATAALHVRAEDWTNPALRQQVLDLARSGRINAVQLDIKDEAGLVGYASQVSLAQTVGAATGYYDARQALDELHDTGVRVIGRIVCFLDPTMAKWAWDNGRPELIVLNASGSGPLDNNYGAAAFSNPANAEVRQYQIDLATEAVALGFDEILYDYVRRPEGDLSLMQLPGLETAPDVTIARFVADTNDALEASGAELGISVFGISATRPEPTAQDMRLLAPHVDYVVADGVPVALGLRRVRGRRPGAPAGGDRHPLGRRLRAHHVGQRCRRRAVAAGLLVGQRDLRPRRGARPDRRRPRRRRRGVPPLEPDLGVQHRRARPADRLRMSDEPAHVDIDDGVATITLDSPANRNALSKALVAGVLGALDTAEADTSVRAIVLTHTPPAFCAGADLKERRDGPPDSSPFVDVLRRLMDAEVPTIAAVDGPGACRWHRVDGGVRSRGRA